MPTGNITGWREVFFDDFNGSHLDASKWRAYTGQPGGDPEAGGRPPIGGEHILVERERPDVSAGFAHLQMASLRRL